jgi:hypothetical protein
VEWLSDIIKSLVGFEPQLGDFSKSLHEFSEPEWVSRIPSYLLADPGCSFQNPNSYLSKNIRVEPQIDHQRNRLVLRVFRSFLHWRPVFVRPQTHR